MFATPLRHRLTPDWSRSLHSAETVILQKLSFSVSCARDFREVMRIPLTLSDAMHGVYEGVP